jgi:hypothetical protein
MSRRNKTGRRPLTVSAAASVLLAAAGLAFIDGLTAQAVLRELLAPILELIATIAIGLVAGQLIEATGWTRRLAVLARPLFRFGRLGDRCAAAFTAAFVSGVASNAMLLDFYKEGAITRRQLYLTNFINQFPAFFLHLPTTFFVVTSMTGIAGVWYFILTFLAAAGRTALLLAYGRLRLPPVTETAERAAAGAAEPATPRHKAAWRAVRERFPARILAICVYVVPIYMAVFLLNRLGFFTWMRDGLAQAVVTAFVPMESLSIVVLSFVAEFTSGFAAAGALMDSGILTTAQTVLALLTGNVLAFPVRALRHQLPHYMGIFAPRMGAELLVLGQLLRVTSLVAAGAVFYVGTR